MPQIEGAPKALNELLERVSSKCEVDGGSKESCARIAFKAAENAGWSKNAEGDWTKMAESHIGKSMTIDNLEIFQAGTFKKGTNREITFSVDDLHTIVSNFDLLSKGDKDGKVLNPPLVIGHEQPGQDGNFQDSTGFGASGWIKSLKVVGDKLVAGVKEIPEKLAQIINSKGFKKVSAELFTNFDGLGPTLRRVAVLGGEIPEVKTLEDIPMAHFAQTEDGDVYTFTTEIGGVIVSEKNPIKKVMEFQDEATQEEIKRVVDQVVEEKVEEEVKEKIPSAPDFEALNARFATLEERVTKLEGKTPQEPTTPTPTETPTENMSESKKIISDLQSKVKDLTASDEKSHKTEIETFTEKLIDEGKIIPAQRKAVVDQLEAADRTPVATFAEKGKKRSQYDSLKSMLATNSVAIDFNETAKNKKKRTAGGKVDMFSDASEDSQDDLDAINQIEKDENITNKEAMDIFYRGKTVQPV